MFRVGDKCNQFHSCLRNISMCLNSVEIAMVGFWWTLVPNDVFFQQPKNWVFHRLIRLQRVCFLHWMQSRPRPYLWTKLTSVVWKSDLICACFAVVGNNNVIKTFSELFMKASCPFLVYAQTNTLITIFRLRSPRVFRKLLLEIF